MRPFFKRFTVGRPELVFLLTGAAFLFGVAVFFFLADEVSGNRYQHLEEAFLRGLRQPGDPARTIGPAWLATWMIELTSLGSGPVLALMVAVVCGYFLLSRCYGSAGLVVCVSVGGAMVADALKHLYDRARPSVVPHLAEVASGSFPSGHSMASSMIYLTLGAILAQATPRWRERAYVMGVAFGVSLLIGVTRVFLGVHYPSDVLAGWAVGMAWASLCWAIFHAFRQRRILR